MKKTVSIALLVVALLVGVALVDRMTRHPNRPTAKAAETTAAPAVTFKSLEGSSVTLDQYKGKVVLVNFWATWCAPCRIEIPWLIEFQQKYGPRGFTVLGVAMDEEGKKAVEPFLKKERFDVNGQQAAINYPILIGTDEIADQFGGLIGIPTSILISRDGKKVKTIMGLVDHEDLVKAIESQL